MESIILQTEFEKERGREKGEEGGGGGGGEKRERK